MKETETEIETEKEKETEGEDTGTEDRRHTPPAVTETDEGGDTDRRGALYDQGVVVMTIAQRSSGHSTEDTANGSVKEKGSHMEPLKVTIHATSPRTCTTTGAAESGSGMSRTGGKAAGVSTNEGGVEPGPIARPPR